MPTKYNTKRKQIIYTVKCNISTILKQIIYTVLLCNTCIMSTIHYKYKGSKERHRGKKRATEILYIQCKSFEQLSLYNKLYNLVLGNFKFVYVVISSHIARIIPSVVLSV